MFGIGNNIGIGIGGGGIQPWYLSELENIDGQSPKYWVDYANNRYSVNSASVPFASAHTFSRASTGTYFNSSGVMQTAAIDAPRLDAKGLLLEGAATNLIMYSQDVTTGWGNNSSTLTANTDVAPDGTTTADTIGMIANIFGGIYKFGHSITAGTTYAFSLYVKNKAGGTKIRFGSDNATAWGSGTAAFATFDTATKQFSSVGSAVQRTGYEVRGDYTYIWSTVTAVGTNADCPLCIFNGDGSTTATFAVWGIQFEVGGTPTSYIPTNGAAASRSADLFAIDGTKFSSWYNATANTMVMDAVMPYMPAGATIWEVRSTDTIDRVWSFVNTNNLDMWARVAGTYDVNGAYAGPYKQGNSFQLGCAWGSSGRKSIINSGKILEDTGTVINNAAHQKFYIETTGGTAVGQIYIKSLKFWPIYASDAGLREATSGYVNYIVDGDSYSDGYGGSNSYNGYGTTPSLISKYNYTVGNTAVGGDTLTNETARVLANLLAGRKRMIFCDGHVNGHGTLAGDIAKYQSILNKGGSNVVLISPVVFPSIVGTADETYTDSLTAAMLSTFGSAKVVNGTAIAEALAGTGRSASGAYAALFQADAVHPLQPLAYALTDAAIAKF